MKGTLTTSLFLCAVTLVLPGLAGATVSKTTTYVMCKNRKIVRTIRVEANEKGACKTIYTKAGVDRIVGNGIRVNSCIGYLKNIEGNLGKASWKCKDVTSSAKISIPKEEPKEE